MFNCFKNNTHTHTHCRIVILYTEYAESDKAFVRSNCVCGAKRVGAIHRFTLYTCTHTLTQCTYYMLQVYEFDKYQFKVNVRDVKNGWWAQCTMCCHSCQT